MKSLLLSFALCCHPFALGDPLPPDAGVPVIGWKDAGKYIDQQVIVQGRVLATKNIGRITFLNFDAGRSFSVVIHDRSYKNFPTPPDVAYDQKLIRVRGLVSEYRNKPQVEVSKPDQIQVLEDDQPEPSAPVARKPREFSGVATIGTFNVLNLFDGNDDPYTADEGTEPKPKDQLERLAETIRKLDADVLALEEVENRGYLERFAASMLPDMDYRQIVCFDSNDERGIDCAILSRFPVGPVTSYRHIEFTDGSGGTTKFQRDLLRARIEPPGAVPFDMFVVHFKSKRGSSASSDRIRLAEATQTRRILEEILKQDPDARFVLCGDFNDTYDSPALKMIRGSGQTALTDFVRDLSKDSVTFNRDPHRSTIDFIFASPAMAKHYVAKSYKVVSSSVEQGGSDHNPVVMQFKLK